MIDNFIDGIKEKWEDLKESVSEIGETVADFIGHSTPKKGALRHDDEWTGHMMDNFIDGVKDKQREWQNTIEGITTFTMPSLQSDIAQSTPQESVVNYTFNQTNNSPKALSTIDIYRQTRNQFSQLKGAII